MPSHESYTNLKNAYGLEQVRAKKVTDPVSPDEYMAALDWQLQNPDSPVALESAESVARWLRKKKKK